MCGQRQRSDTKLHSLKTADVLQEDCIENPSDILLQAIVTYYNHDGNVTDNDFDLEAPKMHPAKSCSDCSKMAHGQE